MDRFWHHFRILFGSILDRFWDPFWIDFGTLFGTILDRFWDPAWDRRGVPFGLLFGPFPVRKGPPPYETKNDLQNGAKIESFSEAKNDPQKQNGAPKVAPKMTSFWDVKTRAKSAPKHGPKREPKMTPSRSRFSKNVYVLLRFR